MRFCEECGAQLEDGAKFCEECGAEQEEIVVASVQGQAPAMAAEAEDSIGETSDYGFCEECGAKIRLTDAFCEACGTAIEQQEKDTVSVDVHEKNVSNHNVFVQ